MSLLCHGSSQPLIDHPRGFVYPTTEYDRRLFGSGEYPGGARLEFTPRKQPLDQAPAALSSVLACLLLLGAIAGLCHLLPRTRQEYPFGVAMLVLGGFILAEGGLSVVIAGLGLMPKGPFHDLLYELIDYDGDRPVVLLIGSSFTERGDRPGRALRCARQLRTLPRGAAPRSRRRAAS